MTRLLMRRLKRLGLKLGFEQDWYLILVAGAIGLVMGSVAMAFILPLKWIEEWSGTLDRSTLLWLVPTAPIVGAALTAVVVRWISDTGHAPGVASVMYAIHRQKAKMPLKVALGKWLASTLTIGSGGSAGAEGPIVTIGSAIGSNIGRLFKANPQNTATLLGCGAAARISSVFNAPIAGVFFVMEILLRDFSLRTFTPIVIASVISSAWTQAVLGEQEALFATRSEIEVQPFSAAGIPNYLLLGLLCGGVAALFVRALEFSEQRFNRLKAPTMTKPLIGAAILGLLGLGFLLLVPAQQGIPPFYGNGYPVIRSMLSPTTYHDAAQQLLQFDRVFVLIVVIAVLKGVGTCLTIGSGGSGGLFAPSLFMGAAVGGSFGYLVAWLNWFDVDIQPSHYALIGMAAMIAATAHAPLTAMLLVYEITQSYGVILPLMLSAVIATIVARLIHPESVYTSKLTQMGVRVGALSDLTILRRLSVSDVPLVQAVLVHEDESAQRLLELSEKHLVRDFVVVNDRNQYVGMVTGNDLSAALVYREAIPLLQVQELTRNDLPTVTPDESLDLVLDKFSTHDAQSLAVLDDTGDGDVRGLITRSRLMERYQAVLSKD